MLGRAIGERFGDTHGSLSFRRGERNRFRKPAIDAERQMRAMLLDSAER